MKLVMGLILGVVGYGVWTLSEPGPGEDGDMSSRLERLQYEWRHAVGKGKQAGDQRKQEMRQEFDHIFKK